MSSKDRHAVHPPIPQTSNPNPLCVEAWGGPWRRCRNCQTKACPRGASWGDYPTARILANKLSCSLRFYVSSSFQSYTERKIILHISSWKRHHSGDPKKKHWGAWVTDPGVWCGGQEHIFFPSFQRDVTAPGSVDPPLRAALIPHGSSVNKYRKQPKQEELNLETQLSHCIQEGKRKITHQVFKFSPGPKILVQVCKAWIH